MATRRMGIILSLLCIALCMFPYVTQAASTADAKEPIQTDRECSLTVRYNCEGAVFSGQTVQLYAVAEVSADYRYTLTAPFAASGLELNGIQTNGEWNVIRSTLEAYVLANGVEPVATAVTDEAGEVSFSALKPGLYLTSAVHAQLEQGFCAFDSALIALPGLAEDGLWQYQITVVAKPQRLPPIEPDETVQWKVVKLWKGDNGKKTRPETIEVEIFRDGESYATAILSEENQWSYSWSAKDDGASWNVVERNIPSGYTMTVEKRETAFVLTNTWNSEDPPSPPSPTGDTSNILLYTTLMYLSGAALVVLGMIRKRKRNEKTNQFHP